MSLATVELTDMQAAASNACALMKVLANPDRLMILCQLIEGEKRVGELEAAARFLAGLGLPFEVRSPEALRPVLRALAGALERAAVTHLGLTADDSAKDAAHDQTSGFLAAT